MIRKSLFTIFFLFLCSLFSWGQNIRVESFNRLDNDITARTSVVLDANDDECALIKMVTTDTDYNVDGYIKRRDDRVGELWFYVPQGTKQIVIRHKRLGKLVYPLPEVLKSKVTYQITLPDNVEIIVHEDAGGQYLVMKVEPAESTVYIDGIAETLNGGVLQKFLSYGAHTYRVEAPLYQPMEGNIQIADARKDMTVSLLPDYGFVKFTSVPENGATVYMNGQELGKTPFTTGRLMKGTYTVNATLPMHAPATQQIMIEPGKTSNVTLNFSASYGTVNLTATGADIYVNNELKGTGKWSGRLSAGLHRIEARKDGHRPGVLSLDVVAGRTQTVSLPAPAPMYASLDISCNQTDAHVYIDGKDMGLAPNIFKVLAGKHTVELKNETFKSQKYEVELTEGEAKRVEGTLSERMKMLTRKDIDFKEAPKYADESENFFVIDNKRELAYIFSKGRDSYSSYYTILFIYSYNTSQWTVQEITASASELRYVEEWDLIADDNRFLDYTDFKFKEFEGYAYYLSNVTLDFVNYCDDSIAILQHYGYKKESGIRFLVFHPKERKLERVYMPLKKKAYSQLYMTDRGLILQTYTNSDYKDRKTIYKNEQWYKFDKSNQYYFIPIEKFPTYKMDKCNTLELYTDRPFKYMDFNSRSRYKINSPLNENGPSDVNKKSVNPSPPVLEFISDKTKFINELKRLGQIGKRCRFDESRLGKSSVGSIIIYMEDDGKISASIATGKKMYRMSNLIVYEHGLSGSVHCYNSRYARLNIDFNLKGKFEEPYGGASYYNYTISPLSFIKK